MAVCNFLIQINNSVALGAHVLTMFRARNVIWLGPLLLCAAGTAAAQAISPAREAELINLVRHDCGACHGLTLKGGLGPALTPQALAGKSGAYLKSIILDGRDGSAMPPWRTVLSEPDVAWIVEKLQKGVPRSSGKGRELGKRKYETRNTN